MKLLDLFPTPRSMHLSDAGVSVSDRAIRFVHEKPLRFGEVPLVEGVVSSGVIVNNALFAEALKKLRSYGIKFASIALPDEKAYLFTTKIESAARADLRDAIAFTIEENAPVKLAGSIYSFETEMLDPESDIVTEAAVTVMPKEVAEAYTEAFESAGITPVSFDLESQALARALIPKGDARGYLIIDLGDRRASFTLVKNEIVRFSSSLMLDLKNLENPEIATALKNEIRKLFLFWKDKKIEHITLVGALAGNESFVATILSEAETPYSIGNAWVNVRAYKKSLPDMPFAESLVYVSAIGAGQTPSPHTYV